MIARLDSWICEFIRGNRNTIEVGKLLTIGLLAALSLFVSIYFLYFSPYAGFRFVYVFIPHLYLIPIILLALWYPKSGIRLVILILICLFTFWAFADFFGFTFPPLFVILYTGIDLAMFVVFLLYIKDQRLVEAVIIDILERSKLQSGKIKESKEKITRDFDSIIISLHSGSDTEREEAISALSELHDPRIILPLITSLRDNNPFIRRSAVKSLGKIQSSKSVRPLIDALADDDRYVRESAAEALGHLGTISNSELIKRSADPDWRIRMGIMIAFRLSPNVPETDWIIRRLSDESVYVRREAVKTLGRIGDKRIIPYLIEKIKDTDPGVRIRVIRAMVKIGEKIDIISLLEKCVHDQDGSVRILAREELDHFSDDISTNN